VNQSAIKPIARGSATRTANMNKRRQHILECASNIIANDGLDAFTLSSLANDAKVTIPTIHNLIGKKSNIIELLVKEMVSRTEQALGEQRIDDPIGAVEDFVARLITLISSNPDLYKAAFIAGERQQLFEHAMTDSIFYGSLELAKHVVNTAIENGHLTGQIKAETLALQIFVNHRSARHDWMHGYSDLNDYRKQVLIGMFFTLAADASDHYREKILKKINALSV
jgi:AcrR family transcriptional regulator